MFKIKRIFESEISKAYYFGYFGMNQVSADDKLILAMRIENYDKYPKDDDKAEIGFFDITDSKKVFVKIGETNSYNWQQGAMLQFLGPDYKSKIIWNVFKDGKYQSCIYDLKSGNNTYRDAIYNIAYDGQSALTIDFERHTFCRRGYSYGNIVKIHKNKKIFSNDGIWLIDLKNNQKKQILFIEDLLKISPLSTMENSTHYVEHILFSPKADKFVFLHRWKHNNGIHSRLLISDKNGNDIRILCDSGRMSHFCWKDNRYLICYGGKKNKINKLRNRKFFLKFLFKPLLPIYKFFVKDSTKLSKMMTGDGYYLIDSENPDSMRLICNCVRSQDGHPVSIPNSNFLITDTYARSEIKLKPKLLIVNIVEDEFQVLDELESIKDFDESAFRCDLHPCLSVSGNIITIDTMDKKQRRIYAYKIERN